MTAIQLDLKFSSSEPFLGYWLTIPLDGSKVQVPKRITAIRPTTSKDDGFSRYGYDILADGDWVPVAWGHLDNEGAVAELREAIALSLKRSQE